MVYSNKLVAVVKHNGRLLAENDGIFRLPYGEEYSVLLKNLSMQDVVVSVSIDGKDVLNGSRIFIRENSQHELVGFFGDDNSVTNKFKFIERTDRIEQHRGANIDDGIINISFQFVRQYVAPTITTWYPPVYKSYSNSDVMYSTNAGPASASCCSSASYISNNNVCMTSSTNTFSKDVGITVKGSKTKQQYTTTYVNNLEDTQHNMILRLQGLTNCCCCNTSKPKPKYSDTKVECETCGRKCKPTMKFCPECGTSLV